MPATICQDYITINLVIYALLHPVITLAEPASSLSCSLPADHDSCWHVQWETFFKRIQKSKLIVQLKDGTKSAPKVTRQNCQIISHAGAGHQLWAHFLTHQREGESMCVCVYEAQCCTWVRMHTAFPSPRSGDCMSSHLDLFQAPVERRVIRDEDQLCSPATNNASQNDKQRTHDVATCQNQQKKSRGSKKFQIPYIILSLLARKASVSKNCLNQVPFSEPFPHLHASWDTLSPWLAGLPPRIQ